MQGCPWEVSGKDEREIMPKIKEHGRTSHNVNSFVKSTED
jgi:predicted small metal-binding protein